MSQDEYTTGHGKVVGIVQARMGSTRLPDKMMLPFGAYPLIDWVLARVQCTRMIDQVVLATSTASENDVLEGVAARYGMPTMRGDEDDVLGRFLLAARQYHADYIVRICGDNPFIAPEEIDRLVKFYFQYEPDYVFNHLPDEKNRYPDGLCAAEILSMELLERLDRLAIHPRYREHVTMYLYENRKPFTVMSSPAPAHLSLPEIKLDINTQEDFYRLSKLAKVVDIHASAETIISRYQTLYPDENPKRCS